jgi:hypothetical protein
MPNFEILDSFILSQAVLNRFKIKMQLKVKRAEPNTVADETETGV